MTATTPLDRLCTKPAKDWTADDMLTVLTAFRQADQTTQDRVMIVLRKAAGRS